MFVHHTGWGSSAVPGVLAPSASPLLILLPPPPRFEYSSVSLKQDFIQVRPDNQFQVGRHPLMYSKLGIVYIITFWYRQEERSLRIALVSASSSLAGAFGG